jgi:hypothetical protein
LALECPTCNPFSTRRPELFHTGRLAVDRLESEVPRRMRWILQRVRRSLTEKDVFIRDALFKVVSGGLLNVLTNPLLTSVIRMQKGRWKDFVGAEFILPAMEEAGLALEFYPAVAEAYKRIPPDTFLREMHALLGM